MSDKFPANSRRSADGLIANLTRFSNLLRDNGIAVSLPAVLDIISGLPIIDIADLKAFQCLLQANLICRKEDMAKFERLFYAYWLPMDRAQLQIPADNKEKKKEPDPAAAEAEKMDAPTLPGDDGPALPQSWHLRYSPDSLSKTEQAEKLRFEESELLYETIRRLLQPLNNRLSRRYQYTIRGKEISLRRVLRKNMQFGGELILLDFKKKKIKNRRVIYLCDVSGSMDVYTLMILQFVHALKRVDRRTEIFFFSTDLFRRTDQFDLQDFSTAISRLPESISDWGGGTRIGHCLQRFNQRYGRRMLSSKDIVTIFSDGWDRGEVDLLEAQMALLKRKAYKVIWLNPLIGTRDYQPICQGMRAALPFVDYFLPAADLDDLNFLSRTLEKMIS